MQVFPIHHKLNNLIEKQAIKLFSTLSDNR